MTGPATSPAELAEPEPGPAPARRAARPVLVGAGILLVGAVAAAAYAFAGPDVPRGTSAAGTPLAGSTAHARSALAAVGSPATVPVTLAGEPATVDAAAAGLRLDLPATLDAARGGPADRLLGLFGRSREVAVVAPGSGLTGELSRLAATFDRPVQEGGVRYDGLTPVGVPAGAGRALQVDGAARAVRADWLSGAPVALPVSTLAPRTVPGAVEAALAGPAQAAVSAPVTLDADGTALVAEPADLATALTFAPDERGALVPVLAGDALLAVLGPRADAVRRPAVDARFDLTSGAPVVVPSQDGTAVDPAALAAAVQPVLLAPAPRSAAVALARTPAGLTTEAAQALGVTEVIGTFTTRHPCCRGRVTNIHTIADLVDGELVLPGQTYSLNGDVGARDRARGFVSAPQISGGQFVDAVGGGVSQFATTMYNAAFFSGMVDVEHKPHSYYISRYPQGREATVSTPSPDLKWRNDSPHAVLVDTSYTGTSITVTLWGTKQYDEVIAESSGRSNIKGFGTEYVPRSDCTSSSGAPGFDITTTRIMKRAGVEVARDSYSHRYLPEPRFICGPPPAPKAATPAPPASAAPPAAG